MRVTAVSVRLPNLNARSLYRLAFKIENATHQMNDFAFRRPFVTANGCEVSILFHRPDHRIKWAEDIFRRRRTRGIIGEKGRNGLRQRCPGHGESQVQGSAARDQWFVGIHRLFNLGRMLE
jgi:hypothetical protein